MFVQCSTANPEIHAAHLTPRTLRAVAPDVWAIVCQLAEVYTVPTDQIAILALVHEAKLLRARVLEEAR